jgi:hypothetical protein
MLPHANDLSDLFWLKKMAVVIGSAAIAETLTYPIEYIRVKLI